MSRGVFSDILLSPSTCYPRHIMKFFQHRSFLQTSEDESGLEVNFFKFAPNLQDHMKAASLIISHAGKNIMWFCIQNMYEVVFYNVLYKYS